MSPTFAARALALVSLTSLASANQKLAWRRQTPSNSTTPFDLGSGLPTTTVSTTVTQAPTVIGAPPVVVTAALTCTQGIIPAGFAAEPSDAAIFCSSFIGIPAVTITTNGITETVISSVQGTTTRFATAATTTPCATSTSTITTVYTPGAARRDAPPITAKAVLPYEHPFMVKERQASEDLMWSDCSTLMSTFSNDCSCLFLTTSTATVCGTTTVTLTESGIVYNFGTATVATCSGTALVTTTKTLQIYTAPGTTSTVTMPPTSISTSSSSDLGSNTTTPALTNSPTSAIMLSTSTPTSLGSVSNNTVSSFPSTISDIVSSTSSIFYTDTSVSSDTFPVGSTDVPVVTTTSNAALSQNSTTSSVISTIPPFPSTTGGDRVGTRTVDVPGTTVPGTNGTTVPGTQFVYTYTIPEDTSTTTLFLTETVTPIPISSGILPPMETTSAPYTFNNGSTPTTTPFPSDTDISSGFPVPPLSQPNNSRSGGITTTSALFPTDNSTAPFPSGTGASSGFPTTSAPFPAGNISVLLPSGTGASSDLPTTSAPFPVGNSTASFPSETGPSSGFPIPSLSQPNDTRSGSIPSTSAPFPASNTTAPGATGSSGITLNTSTAPDLTPAVTSNPYFVPAVTTRLNGTYTTTFTTLVTQTTVHTYNTTITTAYQSEFVTVLTFGADTTATYTGSTVFPSGTAGSIFYSEPVPTTYSFSVQPLGTPGYSQIFGGTDITAPTPLPTDAPGRRWVRVRKDVPREEMLM